MASEPAPVRRPRVGLALGVGGVLGAAWTTGALAALQARLPFPVSEVDVAVGTSAGSVLAAALRCGFTVDEMVAHQRGEDVEALSALGTPDLGCGALPSWPRLRMGSPRLLLSAVRAPHRVHPSVLASACLPQGRADHSVLRAMVDKLVEHGGERPGPRHTWIVAVDYDTGRRVVFGRRGGPKAPLPEAVAASCSVPGWFQPMVIGGRRYVDGGIRSAASVDLLARAGLDEAYVLAPAASLVCGRPRGPMERLERLIRRWMTATVRREVRALRSAGTKVTVLTPGPEDLAVMGANLMDPARREKVFETSMRTSPLALEEAVKAAEAHGAMHAAGPARAHEEPPHEDPEPPEPAERSRHRRAA